MKPIAALALMMCVHVPAYAGDRFYIGAGFGQSSADDVAEADDPLAGQFPPESVSVNGFRFDGEETTWDMRLGWKAKDWLAFEVGYRDLGNFGESAGFRLFGLPDPPFSLGIEQWSLGARFSVPVAGHFAANWFVGASRVDFDADGTLVVVVGLPLPNTIGFVERPFASPDDETGLIWGFGFTWQAGDRFALDLGYRRHDTRVLELDTLALGVLFSL